MCLLVLVCSVLRWFSLCFSDMCFPAVPPSSSARGTRAASSSIADEQAGAKRKPARSPSKGRARKRAKKAGAGAAGSDGDGSASS